MQDAVVAQVAAPLKKAPKNDCFYIFDGRKPMARKR
jgi:hypothetical protein